MNKYKIITIVLVIAILIAGGIFGYNKIKEKQLRNVNDAFELGYIYATTDMLYCYYPSTFNNRTSWAPKKTFGCEELSKYSDRVKNVEKIADDRDTIIDRETN